MSIRCSVCKESTFLAVVQFPVGDVIDLVCNCLGWGLCVAGCLCGKQVRSLAGTWFLGSAYLAIYYVQCPLYCCTNICPLAQVDLIHWTHFVDLIKFTDFVLPNGWFYCLATVSVARGKLILSKIWVVLCAVTGTNLCWSCKGVMQSQQVLSSEAPGLTSNHDQVASMECWSLDPQWVTVWHRQCGLCPGRYDVQAWLDLAVAEGYSYWASTREAGNHLWFSKGTCYQVLPMGTLWSSHGRFLGTFLCPLWTVSQFLF